MFITLQSILSFSVIIFLIKYETITVLLILAAVLLFIFIGTLKIWMSIH